jgi:hypothetical protein
MSKEMLPHYGNRAEGIESWAMSILDKELSTYTLVRLSTAIQAYREARDTGQPNLQDFVDQLYYEAEMADQEIYIKSVGKTGLSGFFRRK